MTFWQHFSICMILLLLTLAAVFTGIGVTYLDAHLLDFQRQQAEQAVCR